LLHSTATNMQVEDLSKRNFLGRSEKMIREHFQNRGMVLMEIPDAKGRSQLEINEFPYYNIRYLLINNICRWVHEEYIDNDRLEMLRSLFDKKYLKINHDSWIELSPRTDYLHTIKYTNRSFSLSHFLALCFLPVYNLIGFNLKEIKRWLLKNKLVKLELIHCDENDTQSWMAFWHGVGMIVEINMKGICSGIVFYLPGGYKDFLEENMNEYLIQAGENQWYQYRNEIMCLWKLRKNTGTEYWELSLIEMNA
jgi:hypothetical protein